jgi:hypothetical protein
MYTPKKEGAHRSEPQSTLFSKGLFFQAKLGKNFVEYTSEGFHNAASNNPDSDIE